MPSTKKVTKKKTTKKTVAKAPVKKVPYTTRDEGRAMSRRGEL